MQQHKNPVADATLKAIQEREKDLMLLQKLCNTLSTVTDKNRLGSFLKENLQELLQYSYLAICTTDEHEKEYSVFFHDDTNTQAAISGITENVADGFFNTALQSADPVTITLGSSLKKEKSPVFLEEASRKGMKEAIAFPLHYHKNNPSVLFIFFKKPNSLSRHAQRLIKGINFQLALTVSNIILYQNIVRQAVNGNVSNKSAERITGTPPAVQNKIVGNSPEMQHVKELVKRVAPSQSGVLLLGESGTGKEVIAGYIHENSAQKDRKMIKVNCAAIPANLLESELFGHEKGAFTGAVERKTGKFEIAHHSTLFLDEIGELPLHLQTKLLRVLQESEFEPIGSSKTIKVNVRIIAATNRNLQDEIARGSFRSDLFYRLNVFPITLPPLRQHKQDIPALSEYFINDFCCRNSRKPLVISVKVLEAMMLYNWPGNIRELKHNLERSILLAETGTITKMDFPDRNIVPNPDTEQVIRPLHEIEKEYILKAIRLCKGRISGPNGAAIRLGLPATTLISKMQKLGIRKGIQ